MAQRPVVDTGSKTKTETIDETDANQQTEPSSSAPTLQLRLEQPRDDRRVVFHSAVIDNEHMNRKKSKCCCIYRKPLAFGESSSEDDEDCEHCFGHPEKRKKNAKKHNHNHEHAHDDDDACPLVRRTEDPSPSEQSEANPGADPAATEPSQQKPPPDEFERLDES